MLPAPALLAPDFPTATATKPSKFQTPNPPLLLILLLALLPTLLNHPSATFTPPLSQNTPTTLAIQTSVRSEMVTNDALNDYVEHASIIAHITNGIALQHGLMNGSIPVNDVIGELLNLGSVDVPTLANFKKDGINSLSEKLKDIKSKLTTDVTAVEDQTLAWNDLIAKSMTVKSLNASADKFFGDVEKFSKNFNFTSLSSFTGSLNSAYEELEAISNYSYLTNPDELDLAYRRFGYFNSSVVDAITQVETFNAAVLALKQYPSLKDAPTIFEPVETVLNLTKTRLNLPLDRDIEIMNATRANLQQFIDAIVDAKSSFEYTSTLQKVATRISNSVSGKTYFTHGFPNGFADMGSLMKKDVQNLWIGKITNTEGSSMYNLDNGLQPLFAVNRQLAPLEEKLVSICSVSVIDAMESWSQLHTEISGLNSDSAGKLVKLNSEILNCRYDYAKNPTDHYFKKVEDLVVQANNLASVAKLNPVESDKLKNEFNAFMESLTFTNYHDIKTSIPEVNAVIEKSKSTGSLNKITNTLNTLKKMFDDIPTNELKEAANAIANSKDKRNIFFLVDEMTFHSCLQKLKDKSAMITQTIQTMRKVRKVDTEKLAKVQSAATTLSEVAGELSGVGSIRDTMNKDVTEATTNVNKLPDSLTKSKVIGQSVNSLRSAFVLGDLKAQVEQLKTIDTYVQDWIKNIPILEYEKTIKGLWGNHDKDMAELDKTLGQIDSFEKNLNVSNLTTIGAYGTPLTALASLTSVDIKAKEKSKALDALLNDGALKIDPTVKKNIEESKKTLDQLADLDLEFASHIAQFQSAPSVFSDLQNFLTNLLSPKQPTVLASRTQKDPGQPTQKSEDSKSDNVWIIVGCVIAVIALIASGVFICWKKQWFCFKTTVVPCECLDMDKNDEKEPLDPNILHVVAHSQTFGRHAALYATWKRQMDCVSNSNTSEDRAAPYMRLSPRKYRDINIHLNPTNAIQTVRVHGNRFRTRKGTIFNVTQSPMSATDTNDDTTGDFLRLIIEDQTDFVVMCENMVACAPYFSLYLGSIEVSGYKVYTESIRYLVQNSEEVLVRTIRIVDKRNKNISKTVTHYHILNWDKFGIPSCSFEMMAMIHKEIGGSQAPVLVHCSNGIGPAMMFTGIDYVSRWMEIDESMTFEESFKRLAEKRHHSVQNVRQIGWIHVGAVYMLSVNNEVDLFGYNDIKGIFNDMIQKRVGVPRDAQI
ncbi:hypothetical protein GCK72_016048 [Caenorhabditis remanei]|uniref:Tyrosine-protein phosphatase domain-containing protein n=1 Tax=Caenorhabditis remanei TaxID=31234 RepID=A0A6A5GY06_CAERE|nr:hypothetical protein GCK72_016048 [Caenorhabditis remanei]KAF1759581.1 hypothetical protein GCK72_016048 [Caenorhabditis remanei]